MLDKKYTNLAGNKGRDYVGDLGINGKIILTRTIIKLGSANMNWIKKVRTGSMMSYQVPYDRKCLKELLKKILYFRVS